MVNVKRIGCLLLIIVTLSCVLTTCLWSNSSNLYYTYNTEDEVVNLFQNNIDDFDLYVNKFYGHHMWGDYFDDRLSDDFQNYKHFKKYITPDEFAYLQSFDQKFHPAFWYPNGLGFRTENSSLRFIKIMNPDVPIADVELAKNDGLEIQYYENEWICIHYLFE